MSRNWTERLVADSLLGVNLLAPSPASSVGRLVNGKQGAYCPGGTNPNFIRTETPTVWRGTSLRKGI